LSGLYFGLCSIISKSDWRVLDKPWYHKISEPLPAKCAICSERKMSDNTCFDKSILWFFILLFAFLMGMVFSYTPYRIGDSSEYMMATESIIYDHDLVYDKAVDLKRTLERKPVTFDTPAGLHLIKDTRDGKVRFGLHSFYYPLSAAPFYLAFSVFGKPFSYFGFYFFNALMFFGSILMGFLYLRDKNGDTCAIITSALFFLLSASMTYVLWIHSEMLMLFLVTAYLFFWHKEKYILSALFIGFAAGVKLPILALLLPFWYELIFSKREYKKTFICLVITIAMLSPQIFYNVYYLGAFNAVVREGMANLKFITPSTVIGSFISPFYGLIWFYPMAAVAVINMERKVKNYLLLLSSVVIITAMNSTMNIVSDQVGLRYLMLIYPLFLFISGKITFNLRNKVLIALSTFMIAGVVINPINNSLAPFPTFSWQFTYLPYKVSKYVLHIKDNPEVTFNYSIKLGERVAVIAQDFHVAGTSWLQGDKWVKFLIRGVSKGEISVAVNGWPRPTPQKFMVRVNGSKKFDFSIKPGWTNTFTIPIGEDDIYHYSERPVKDVVYLDLYAEAWKPSETVKGSTDSRNYGIAPVAMFNNDELLFGKAPPERAE